MLVERLISEGWPVWALCLMQSSADELARLGASVAAVLDVTDHAAILAIAARCSRECPDGIHALVNNAGVGCGAHLEWASAPAIMATVNVNLVGLIFMTQAFLPLLRLSGRGRLVNVSSMLGRIGVPGLAVYCATKHGVEGFSDAVRQEMKPFGVTVSIIEPGFMQTPIVHDAYERLVEAYKGAPAHIREAYGDLYVASLREQVITATVDNAGDPIDVLNAMMHAVTAASPRARYAIGTDMMMARIASMMPAQVSDWLQGIGKSTVIPSGAKPRL